MYKVAIRNLQSKKMIPPRLFDVVVDGEKVNLEIKTSKNEIESISWEDVIYQVDAAKKKAANE